MEYYLIVKDEVFDLFKQIAMVNLFKLFHIIITSSSTFASNLTASAKNKEKKQKFEHRDDEKNNLSEIKRLSHDFVKAFFGVKCKT